MPRVHGSKNKGKDEFARLYEQALIEEKVNPVRALVKLMKSRTQSIRLQAIATGFKYRFPVVAVAKIEVEAAAQMVMTWEQDVIEPVPVLPALEHIADGSEPGDQREFVRHEIDDPDIPL